MKKDGKKNKEREVACNIHLGMYTLARYLEIKLSSNLVVAMAPVFLTDRYLHHIPNF